MRDKDFEVEEGNEVVRHTIVGGRPLARKHRKIRVPIGIEKLLCRAAADAGLRNRLLNDREATLARLKAHLSAPEAAILASIPRDTLSLMIDRIDLKQHARRKFMRGVLAASLAAATSGCFDSPESQPTGISPDVPDVDVQGEIDVYDTATSRGAVPDADFVSPDDAADAAAPESSDDVLLETDSLPAPGGILPDDVR